MVRKGRVAVATAVVGLAALTGGSFLMPKDYLPSEQEFPLKRVEQLVINTDDSVITYAERTPQEAANDMYGLVKSHIEEEAWIEIIKNGNESRTFFEVGIKNNISGGERETSGLVLRNELVETLLHGQQRLGFWHDHPEMSIEKRFADERKNPALRAEAIQKCAYHGTQSAFPSYRDVPSMIRLSYAHDETYWNNLPFNRPEQRHYIRSEHGIMHYELTPEGRKHYFSLADEKGLAYMVNTASLDLVHDLNAFVNNKEITIRSVCPGPEIKALVKEWQHPYMSLSFTPNEEIGLELTRYELFAEKISKKFEYPF